MQMWEWLALNVIKPPVRSSRKMSANEAHKCLFSWMLWTYKTFVESLVDTIDSKYILGSLIAITTKTVF